MARQPIEHVYRVPHSIDQHHSIIHSSLGLAIEDEPDLLAIARSEGWLTPPPEVTGVPLRPWQQAVFWGLRIYIVVMLVVMVLGFVQVTNK